LILATHLISDWSILDEHISLWCNSLPDDYLFTLVKLKSLPQLSNDDHQQLDTMISSSCEAQLVNEKIVTFLIVKFCFNGSGDSLGRLCDVIDNLTESGQSATRVQQVRSGKCLHKFKNLMCLHSLFQSKTLKLKL